MQEIQVSSTSIKFQTEKRLKSPIPSIQLKEVLHNPNPKRGPRPKVFTTLTLTEEKSFMVLAAAQTTAFFENPDQLCIPHKTMVEIQREGIQMVAACR